MKRILKFILLSFVLSLMLILCNRIVQAKENEDNNYLEDTGYVKYLRQQQSSSSLSSNHYLAGKSNANLSYTSTYASQEKYDAIDVSQFQGNINWTSVKNAGIELAIIRAGGRYYGSGGLYTDTMFEQNLKAAKDVGIKVGVYFYSNAINITEAIAEANYAVNLVKNSGVQLDMPIFMDYEGSGGVDNGRFEIANPGPVLGTNICRSFCNTVINSGYDAGIYSGYYFLTAHGNPTELAKDYKMWYANYNSNGLSIINYPIDIWQYTGSGSVNGITGNVDRNIVFIQKPSTVKNLKLEVLQINKDNVKAKVSWDKVTNATKYRIAIFRDETKKKHENCPITTVTVSFNVEGTVYAKVCAVNEKFGIAVRSNYVKTEEKQIKFDDTTDITPEPEKQYPDGDINNDGIVNLKDILRIRRYIATIKTGKHKEEWSLSELEKNYADINKDGTIDLRDVLQIRKIIAKNKLEQ